MKKSSTILILICTVILIFSSNFFCQVAQSVKRIPVSKFSTREAIQTAQAANDHTHPVIRNKNRPKCDKLVQELDLIWTAKTGSSLYQTPVLFDLFGEGKMSVISPTFIKYVEVLRGKDGSIATTQRSGPKLRRQKKQFRNDIVWPFQDRHYASHSSALLYDIDNCGEMEIVLSLFTGEIAFLKQDGSLLREKTIKLQPLRVLREWYKGMSEIEDADISMNLREQQKEEEEASKQKQSMPNRKLMGFDDKQKQTTQIPKKTRKPKPKILNPRQKVKTTFGATKFMQSLSKKTLPPPPKFSFKKKGFKKQQFDTKKTRDIGFSDFLSPEALESLKLIYSPDDSIIDKPKDLTFFSGDYEKELLEMLDRDNKQNPGKYVYVDPHIISTPVIIDIDGDGHDEIIIAVSYYYDQEYYANPKHMKRLESINGDPVDITKYIAGGIVVYDLKTMQKKWDVQLDLTTDKTQRRAYIYSSPTVADIDGDGSLEIVIGTNVGFIYAFDKNGKDKPGFPILMGKIQGQILVEDVNSDGKMEICAADFNSNLACFNFKGEPVWETRISGFAGTAPTVGDVNGDGVLELVVGTSTGHVWAVSGKDGSVVPNYPIATKGPIYSPITLTKLERKSLLSMMDPVSLRKRISETITTKPVQFAKKIKKKLTGSSKKPAAIAKSVKNQGLDLVFPSHDGFLYVVNGKSGCLIEKIDIGEKSYSQALVADITGNGKLEILVSTMNGNLYCFATSTPSSNHPLRSTTHQIASPGNGFAYRDGYHGIYVLPAFRRMRDIVGNRFKIAFEIVDKRKILSDDTSYSTLPKKYRVKISIGNDVVLLDEVFLFAGKYVKLLPVPKERMFGTVVVEMTNERGQVYTDSFAVSFNMEFLKIVKWMIIGPFLLAVAVLYYFLPTRKPILV